MISWAARWLDARQGRALPCFSAGFQPLPQSLFPHSDNSFYACSHWKRLITKVASEVGGRIVSLSVRLAWLGVSGSSSRGGYRRGWGAGVPGGLAALTMFCPVLWGHRVTWPECQLQTPCVSFSEAAPALLHLRTRSAHYWGRDRVLQVVAENLGRFFSALGGWGQEFLSLVKSCGSTPGLQLFWHLFHPAPSRFFPSYHYSSVLRLLFESYRCFR